MKQLLKYMVRWQLSTPILAIIPIILFRYIGDNFWVAAFVSNLVGSLIFYKIDKMIFAKEISRIQKLRSRVVRRQMVKKLGFKLYK